MLEKTIKRQLDQIEQSKKDMLEINNSIFDMNIEIVNANIATIEKKLENELLTDNERIDLEKELSKYIEEKNKYIKDKEQEEKEISEIGSELTLEDTKFKGLDEAIDFLIQAKNDEGRTEGQIKNINRNINLLADCKSLSRLEKFNTFKNNKYLKDNYDNIAKDLQTKMNKNNKFIFPSCFQIKKNIKSMVLELNIYDNENDLNKYSKMMASAFLLHLSKIDVQTEGIYIYYMLQSIYKIDSMPLEPQLEFKKKLIDILKLKLK